MVMVPGSPLLTPLAAAAAAVAAVAMDAAVLVPVLLAACR